MTQPQKNTFEIPQPAPEPQDKLSEGRLAPDQPLRSSSSTKLPVSNSLPVSGPSSDDQTKSSRRGSKGSLIGRRHSGSVASSTHSRKEKRLATKASGQEKATDNSGTASSTEKKERRGVSKLLSFLNCCSAPENANIVSADDQVGPARKANKLQPTRGRQATPINKPDASAAESSTGESKEATDEKIGGPQYSDLPAAAEPKMVDQRPKGVVLIEKPTRETNQGPYKETKGPGEAQTTARDQPLPPIPGSEDSVRDDVNPGDDAYMASDTKAVAEMPKPTIPIQEMAINDRTPQQEERDSDIVMADAPPVTQPTDEPSSKNEGKEANPTHANLPPPPPLARDAQASSGAGTVKGNTNVAIPNEKQQWLLPPLQPHFQGKKCLVLDLDETLVHSSFKVSVKISNTLAVLTFLDSSSSGFHYTC